MDYEEMWYVDHNFTIMKDLFEEEGDAELLNKDSASKRLKSQRCNLIKYLTQINELVNDLCI